MAYWYSVAEDNNRLTFSTHEISIDGKTLTERKPHSSMTEDNPKGDFVDPVYNESVEEWVENYTKEDEFYDNYEQKLSIVRNNAGNLIESRFPAFDQRNLSNGTKTEIRDRETGTMVTQSEMNTIINDMITACDNKEAGIEQVNTDYEAGNITIDTALSDLDAIDVSESELRSVAGW